MLSPDIPSIHIQASGLSADDLEVVYFSREDMRNMAGWLINKCISDEDLGSFATQGLTKEEEHIMGSIERHEDKWRKRTCPAAKSCCSDLRTSC